jgi:hypothetical protein
MSGGQRDRPQQVQPARPAAGSRIGPDHRYTDAIATTAKRLWGEVYRWHQSFASRPIVSFPLQSP